MLTKLQIRVINIPETLRGDGNPESVKNLQFPMAVAVRDEKPRTFIDQLKEEWEVDKKRWGIK